MCGQIININEKYCLLQTGRFAHSKVYIESLAYEHGFEIKYSGTQNIRKEKGGWVKGHNYILRCES